MAILVCVLEMGIELLQEYQDRSGVRGFGVSEYSRSECYFVCMHYFSFGCFGGLGLVVCAKEKRNY